MESSAGGLAGRVRGSTESDQFDLAGYTKDQCRDLVQAAFREPFLLSEMVRLSFVVGGGKLCRQKYSDDLPKDLCSALQAIGYNDDKAAACELSSAGSYKYQHDTSKNLKFVHVFPLVAAPAAAEGEGDDEAENQGPREPADVLAECELADFRRMVESHVCGYSQKKRLLDALRDRLNQLQAAEQKLITRGQLSDVEQRYYDTLNADALKEKATLVTVDMQALIEGGLLTSAEKEQVQEQLKEKLAALEVELKKVQAESKAKMEQKLLEQREKLQGMRAAVSDAPAHSHPLRHATEIRRLRGKLLSLQKLEKPSGGHYTVEELKKLGEKPELEEAISVLEERSRMWFETDEEFDVRLQKCLKEAVSSQKKSGGGAKAPANDGFTAVKGKRR
mmetsp:Transcript_16276/g.35621  ORF Transcript_16276/g.35621 Transcript_16276/m.35621 type:complete len:391 (-) Transcript_16276:183-1355(-)